MKLVVGEDFLKPLTGGLGSTLKRVVVHVHESEPFGVAACPLCGTDSTQTAQGGYTSYVRFVDSLQRDSSAVTYVLPPRHKQLTILKDTKRYKLPREVPSFPMIASQVWAIQLLQGRRLTEVIHERPGVVATNVGPLFHCLVHRCYVRLEVRDSVLVIHRCLYRGLVDRRAILSNDNAPLRADQPPTHDGKDIVIVDGQGRVRFLLQDTQYRTEHSREPYVERTARILHKW